MLSRRRYKRTLALTVLALPVCAGLWARLKLLPHLDGEELLGLRLDRILIDLQIRLPSRGASLVVILLIGCVCPSSCNAVV